MGVSSSNTVQERPNTERPNYLRPYLPLWVIQTKPVDYVETGYEVNQAGFTDVQPLSTLPSLIDLAIKHHIPITHAKYPFRIAEKQLQPLKKGAFLTNVIGRIHHNYSKADYFHWKISNNQSAHVTFKDKINIRVKAASDYQGEPCTTVKAEYLKTDKVILQAPSVRCSNEVSHAPQRYSGVHWANAHSCSDPSVLAYSD